MAIIIHTQQGKNLRKELDKGLNTGKNVFKEFVVQHKYLQLGRSGLQALLFVHLLCFHPPTHPSIQ